MKRGTPIRLKSLLTGRKPGLMARLSHLIIIQVIFVFVALALLVFAPHSNLSISSGEGHHYAGFENLVRRLNPLPYPARIPENDTLAALLRGEPTVRDAGVYVRSNGGVTCISEYHRDSRAKSFPWNESTLLSLGLFGDRQASADGPPPVLPLKLTDRFVVYCSPVTLADGTPGMFVAAWDHNLFLWDRTAFGHALLLLFLFAALVALLTVYLIHRRFTQPLRRMTNAFEKTGDGELYYLMENAGEEELKRLAGVFNKLSRTLWKGRKQLQAYDDRLRVAALSLEESQQLLSAVIDNSPVGVITVDAEDRVVLFNRMAARLYGYENDDPIGRPWKSFVANRPTARPVEGDSDGEVPGFEVLAKRRDGSQFPACLIAAPLTTGKGESPGCVYIVKDITQSKDFQKMMIRLDRYYTRGEMASEIAHEINNYLSILLGSVELVPLLLRRGQPEKLDAKLELMRATIERIARFTDGLLDGSHDEIQFCQVDINQIVENVLAFLKPQNRFDGIEVVTDLAGDIPLVEIDPGLIQQVLVNLIYNAADAVSEIADDRLIQVTTWTDEETSSPEVGIRVEDNGPGVVSDKEPLLFKQRFTTKPNGHGIGLITCRKILDSHRGEIKYELASGARFTFTLPVKHASSVEGVGTGAQKDVAASAPA